SGEGIIKVVGEVGSGKTMLCRMLEQELPAHVEVVYIANPSLAPENILHVVAFELKLPINNDTSRLTVMQLLHEYLLQKHANNRQVVVFVEEAQGMPIETLEEIRLLSNLETSDHKLLQMVLFGQPELDEKLRNPSIRQLKERITHSFYLDPFPRSEIYQYLNFRMRAVGYRGPDIFSQTVANNIEKKSQGLTRRINILADKALLAAFAEGGHGITSRHINIAARDSDFGQASWRMPRWLRHTVTGTGLMLLVITAVWIGTQIPQADESPATTAPAKSTLPSPVETLATPATIPVVATSTQNLTPSVLPSALQQRMTTTEQWLNNVADDHFSIQLSLLEASEPVIAEQYIQRAARLIGLDNIFVYEATIREKPVYSVLYSDYPNREMAVIALLALPEKLRADGAFVRPVKGVKADVPNNSMGEL
ncbi:MAG TPA: AAA family ATPase, partial [Gammaproteobacteria bacterium]|nr:AAA family ATPase [Gammaproteobacteria bacterium]